ncbi:MAG: hypothetical protein CMM47_04935 [Rhodospirillaceae bacterium]|nr:hypothetical protein [Rhodospirillaceae bacterium]
MSLPDQTRRSALVGLMVAATSGLWGCGFQPLYGRTGEQGTNVVDHLAAIRIEPIPDRVGQILRNGLRDKLTPRGKPLQPMYRLVVSLIENRADLVILQDATSTFAKVRIRANFVLTDVKTGQTLTRGKSESTTIFNIVESEFANINAETGARARAANEISDDIRQRIGLYFRRQNVSLRSL